MIEVKKKTKTTYEINGQEFNSYNEVKAFNAEIEIKEMIEDMVPADNSKEYVKENWKIIVSSVNSLMRKQLGKNKVL